MFFDFTPLLLLGYILNLLCYEFSAFGTKRLFFTKKLFWY